MTPPTLFHLSKAVSRMFPKEAQNINVCPCQLNIVSLATLLMYQQSGMLFNKALLSMGSIVINRGGSIFYYSILT